MDVREVVDEATGWEVDLRLLDDPEAAFGQFYEEFAPRLRNLARRFRRADDLAEDLVQEVLLRAYRAEIHLQAGSSPWPWLSTVCRNLAIDVGRRREVRGEQSLDTDVLAGLPAPAELLGDPEAWSVMHAGDLADALAHLDERQRRMLVLKHVRGWSYEEIAEWEGISFPALRSALSRARKKLTATYAALVEGRGVVAIAGPVFAPLSRKLRALRGRVAGGEAALLQQAAAASPGFLNTVATTVALGALSVMGPLVTSGDRSSHVELAETSHVASSAPSYVGLDARAQEPAAVEVAPEPVVVEPQAARVEPAPAAATTEVGSPPPRDLDAETGHSEGEVRVEVDTSDVVPSDDAPVQGSAGGGATTGSGGGRVDDGHDAKVAPGAGDEGIGVGGGGSAGGDCPPPEERGITWGTACSLLEDDADATDGAEGDAGEDEEGEEGGAASLLPSTEGF